MAVVSRAEAKDMYSWWWDSHISPKNSKWLQENLTDMDSKIRVMIELIEVDEDSFARRAEMYYKKRPELMKLVEEFYRAYRALAERYDHATGVIRQAHHTMAEAFPNQVPLLLTDDVTVNQTHGSDPKTPEIQPPVRASFDLDELDMGEMGLSSADFHLVKENGDYTKGPKQVNGSGKARKGLNFNEVDDNRKEDTKTQVLSESDRLGKSETDIQSLKEALAKLEAEKESGLSQYHQTIERLSKLETEVSRAKRDSEGLDQRASKAEAQVQSLKEALAKVEAEREASLLQYQKFHEEAFKAEKETKLLNEELTQFKADKDALLSKYLEALEMIANVENKLLLAEDYASRTNDRAVIAEKEVENLTQTIIRLTVENEAVVLKYEECLEKIALLDREITRIQEENGRLKTEVGIQSQELSEKQKEMGRLWTSVQEERMRFTEVETSFQSLQNLHSKVQEELRSCSNELQKKVQVLKEMEIENLHLIDEVQKVKEVNKGLNDLNMSSGVSIKNMQEEISELKDGKEKVEQELELQLDQMYSLKEELNSLNQKHQDVLVQMELVGFDPESFGSSVKELKDENSMLKDICQKSNVEMDALVEKLALMEKLLEKNQFLENSLLDLSAELERTRAKMEALEESIKVLRGEKFAVVSQLQITTENLDNLSERNTFMEISLSETNAELEMLRAKSKSLEDQNSVLIVEKQTLSSQMESTQQRLEDIGKRHVDLEKRYSGLEVERESTLHKVEELQFCLDIEKQEHDSYRQLSQIQMAEMENQIRVLQEIGDYMREEFEEELDLAINAQFEIFILRKSIQDLKTENTSLLVYCEKLIDASHLSEKLVLELERTSNEQKEEVRVASSQIRGLRSGMFQLLDALETNVGLPIDGYEHEDQKILNHILGKFGDIKRSFSQLLNENEELVIEKSVLVEVLRQLKQDVGDLNAVIIILGEEISVKNDHILVLQKEMQKLLESNEELILKVREGNQREVVLLNEMENLREKLFSLKDAYENLREENTNVLKDKEYLMKAVEDLEDEKQNLEHECSCIVGEAVSLDNLSVIFKNVLSEKSLQVTELRKKIDKLCSDNSKLEKVQAKNVNLEVLLKKTEKEMEEVRVVNDRLKDEITNAEDLLWLKEMKLLEVEAIKVHQENMIFELSDNYAQKMEEWDNVRHHLNSQISEMRKENEEMQKGKDEVKLWETVGGTFFTELQSCSVREALIREKFSELMRAYETLEEESYSKGVDIAQLRERVGVLENENCEVNARLARELSAVSSLRDSVSSLEKHTIWHVKFIRTDNEEKEDAEHCQNFSQDKVADLKNLESRIQAVEKSVIELKQRAEEEYSTLRSDLDSATRQVEVLKSQNNLRRGSSGRFTRRFSQDELRTKDIMLDQISNCSSSGKNRRNMGSDDLILELWETMDQGGSVGLTVGNPCRSNVVVPNNKNGRPSSESMVEKEVGVDEQDNSNRFLNTHQEDTKRKVLGRLASDVQKLTNLQITVQDLKERVEMTENDSTEDQLGETEETILKLFDYSAKLMKKIEKSSPDDSSYGGSARRRRCLDQARKISEKIGKMQMDVQKIQFHLMKIDSNNKVSNKSGGTRITERDTEILLRDYLYGVSKTPRRRKKSHFCGCVQPPTKGD